MVIPSPPAPLIPKGFIEVPYGPNLVLINTRAIAQVKIHDKQTHIMLTSPHHTGGTDSVITTLSYEEVRALIVKAQK